MDENGAKNLKKIAIISSIIGSSSFLIIFIIIIVVVLGILFGWFGEENSGEECVALPTVSSVCKSITIEGEGTMDLDEYVAGVISAEVGGLVDDDYDMYKAGAIAARSYVLANAKQDDSGNCVVESGQHFQVYKANPDQTKIDAAKETSGVVLVKDNKIYSTQYDAFCYTEKDGTNYQVCQGNNGTTTIPVTWVDDHVPSDYRAKPNDRNVSHGNGMSQYGAFYLITMENKDYKEVLEHFYGDDGAVLASINNSSSLCGSSNLSTLSSYTLGHNGLNVLNRTLSESEISDLNSYINKEVNKAGYGTGDGVAAAGQALVYWLEKKGYYLQYYWGGGQGLGEGNGTFIGANPKWGSTEFGDDQDPGGNKRIYYGMDCSGFTSWAVRTACAPNSGSRVAEDWIGISSSKTSLKDAKPGDMLASSGHVQLVVKNNGDGTVIVAEETGGSTSGLVFTNITSIGSGYTLVDMSSWYQKTCS